MNKKLIDGPLALPRSQADLKGYQDPVIEYPPSEADSTADIPIKKLVERLMPNQVEIMSKEMLYHQGDDEDFDAQVESMPVIFKKGADLTDIKRSVERSKELIANEMDRRRKLFHQKLSEQERIRMEKKEEIRKKINPSPDPKGSSSGSDTEAGKAEGESK